MEQNLPVIAKKAWSFVRAMFFMLKKGISKSKFLADLNIMMKRGKIAGKALQNLLFHHHHNWAAATFHRHPHGHRLPSGEYEFSCSSTPSYPLSLHKKHHNNRFSSPNMPPTVGGCDDKIIDDALLLKVLGMLTSATESPAPPGFENSPMVEQMKITDSPFYLTRGGDDRHVDEAAEKFIRRFYDDRRREN